MIGRRVLIDAAREAFRNDFARDELPMVVRSVAESRGLPRPTDEDVRSIVREVVPHAAV